MRRSAVIVAGVFGIATIAGGVWVWRTAKTDAVCDRWQETVLDGDGPSGNYATAEEALVGFGEFSGIRGHLPPESLVPTDEASPEFGATIHPDKRDDREGRVYDIWRDGVIVQSVMLDQISGRWGVGGYSGCIRPDLLHE